MQVSENLFGFESSQPTVGIGIAPIQLALADFYRRSGITPCPEDLIFNCSQDTTRRLTCQGKGSVVK